MLRKLFALALLGFFVLAFAGQSLANVAYISTAAEPWLEPGNPSP